MLPWGRWVMEVAFPCSLLQDWFTHTCANRVGAIVLPRQGEGPALLSVTGGGQGQLSCSYDQRAISTIPQVLMGVATLLSPMPPQDR